MEFDLLNAETRELIVARADVRFFVYHRFRRSRNLSRETPLKVVYSQYLEWCAHLGITPIDKSEVRSSLEKLGVPRTGFGDAQRYYLSLRKEPFA